MRKIKTSNLVWQSNEDIASDLQLARSRELPGQIPRGAKVVKIVDGPNDLHPVGSEATVIGCFARHEDGEFGYFVEWDDLPGEPAIVRGLKIQALSRN